MSKTRRKQGTPPEASRRPTVIEVLQAAADAGLQGVVVIGIDPMHGLLVRSSLDLRSTTNALQAVHDTYGRRRYQAHIRADCGKHWRSASYGGIVESQWDVNREREAD